MKRQFDFDKISPDQKEMLMKIVEFVKDNYSLPIREQEAFIGFGKLKKFYMFWFAVSDEGELYFKSRKFFRYSLFENTVEISVVPQNELLIMDAINNIYEEYVRFTESGEIDDSAPHQSSSDQDLSTESAPKKRRGYKKKTPTEPEVLSPESIRWKEIYDRTNSLLRAYAEEDTPLPYLNSDLFEAEREEIYRLLKEMVEHILATSSIKERNAQALMQYTFSDDETLASIAEELQLSRERIRQINVKSKNKVLRLLNRSKCRDDFTDERLNRIFDIITSADKGDAELLSLLIPHSQSPKKHGFFIAAIFTPSIEKMVSNLERNFKEHGCECKMQTNYFELHSKAVFPSDPIPLDNIPKPCEPEQKYAYIQAFKARLDQLGSVIHVIESPDIVYYSSSKTDHRPDFMIVTENKIGILVVVLSTSNMGVCYNVTRFNQLHVFCQNHGYGYLICDERGYSIQELKNSNLDPNLTNELNRILDSQGYISWDNILDIKTRYTISNRMISAYALKNKLYLNRMPFIIQTRKSRDK